MRVFEQMQREEREGGESMADQLDRYTAQPKEQPSNPMNVDSEKLGDDEDTARIEMFSDGVFAIAITLLVLEVRVPHLEELPRGTSLFRALVEQWPSFFGYVMSFVIIGIIWSNHHNRFKYIKRSDHNLLIINTLFLMCVAFIPFPTALLAEYIQDSNERLTAVAVYSGTLTLTSILFNLLWWYAAHNHRLVDRTLNPRLLQAMTRHFLVGPLLYLLSFGLAFVSITASLSIYAILALMYILPGPTRRSYQERQPRKQQGKA